jgi:uncharacterized cupin superfamily protein
MEQEREVPMSDAERPKLRAPALDPATIKPRHGTIYPESMKAVVDGRFKQALGNALGLTNLGVNLTRLKPGAASAHRHWHTRQDEFIYILEGQATLITNEGEQVLDPGMAAGFAAGAENGHHLVNRSASDVVYLEIGDRTPGDEGRYPDVDLDLRVVDGAMRFFHKNGRPY